jgi:hypothetical protein
MESFSTPTKVSSLIRAHNPEMTPKTQLRCIDSQIETRMLELDRLLDECGALTNQDATCQVVHLCDLWPRHPYLQYLVRVPCPILHAQGVARGSLLFLHTENMHTPSQVVISCLPGSMHQQSTHMNRCMYDHTTAPCMIHSSRFAARVHDILVPCGCHFRT